MCRRFVSLVIVSVQQFNAFYYLVFFFYLSAQKKNAYCLLNHLVTIPCLCGVVSGRGLWRMSRYVSMTNNKVRHRQISE